MNKQSKQIFIWVGIFLCAVFIFNLIQGDFGSSKQNLPMSDFLNRVDNGEVTSVKIQDRTVEGILSDGKHFSTYTANYPYLIDRLNEKNVHIEVIPPDTKMNFFINILASWFPMLLLIGVWVFFIRQMQGGGKGMGFARSKAKLVSDKGPKITFDDVAGIDEAKDELIEVVEFLRNPRKFLKIGGKIPKGCLLIGPPGTGKTLLAKAIAGEANVPFFNISGSDFVEMFVGVGASRVRDMFEQGKRNAPCIIFIDEIDAVGRQRGAGLGSGHDEREQTLNQMLVEMDGFDDNEGVIIIAATNRPDVLDSALLRPGRFDRQIVISNPDIDGREQILKVHMRNVKCAGDVDPRIIARGTPGFSGAELKNLVNEAALLSARKNKKFVTMDMLEEAKDKVMMGTERRSMVISDEQKKLTAYHEGGHALVGIYCKGSDPIHKATIIPRGRALGMVQRLPENDKFSITLEQMKAHIAVAMAGRAAEEIIFGEKDVTSGASSDIQMATNMAKSMVTEWGLSKVIGPVFHGGNSHHNSYLDHKFTRSEHTAELIDKEVLVIINEGYLHAKKILLKHIDQLHILAGELIAKETLTGEQIKTLLFTNDQKLENIEKKEKRKRVATSSENTDKENGSK